MKALKCRECGREYPLTANHVCEFDFGPLEVAYDYDRIKSSLTRAAIQSRPQNMWRYRELLPVAGEPDRRAARSVLRRWSRPIAWRKRLGIRELWIKNDTVNYPTLVVQGSRRQRGVEPRARTRLHNGRLRFDRQSGELGRRQCGCGGIEGLCFHSVGSGAGQDHQFAGLRRAT